MKAVLRILILACIFSACSQKTETFEYTISGKIIGPESGQVSIAQNGKDDIIINYDKSRFEYSGTSGRLHFAGLSFGGDEFYPIIIEPGEIMVELHKDSMVWNSRTMSGENSKNVYQATKKYMDFYLMNMDMEVLLDSIKQLIHDNRTNYAGIFLLNSMGRYWPLYEQKELGEFLERVEDPMFLNSADYRELYAYWLAQKDSINKIDQEATAFTLPDISGELRSFTDISKDKYVYVELSSTSCSNSTQASRDLLPVYDRYKEKGFEIITMVWENDYTSWKEWVDKENFPWVTLIELDMNSESDVLLTELLFNGGNYLVNTDGIVIANNLNASTLKAQLENTFD
jgi:hypothetical protein